MAERKPPSSAMVGLCAEVNRRGRADAGDLWRDVTPTKVERWLQAELVPEPGRPGCGQGAGRRVIYGEDQVERIVEIGELVRLHRSLDDVALCLFARGRIIEGERVRRALLSRYERTRRDANAAAERGLARLKDQGLDQLPDGGTLSPGDQADLAEPVIADRLRRDPMPGLSDRIQEVGAQPGAGFQAIARVASAMALGEPIPEDDAAFLGQLLTGNPEDASAITNVGMDRLEQTVRNAAPEDFGRALPMSIRLFELFDRFLDAIPDSEAETLRTWFRTLEDADTEIDQAQKVIFILMIEQHLGSSFDPILDELGALIEGLEE